MKTVSIGYTRDDGDFAILATLNNNDDHLTHAQFVVLVRHIKGVFENVMPEPIQILERQDAPDYVEGE